MYGNVRYSTLSKGYLLSYLRQDKKCNFMKVKWAISKRGFIFIDQNSVSFMNYRKQNEIK